MKIKKHHTYKFNPHTLSYEKVKVTFRDRLKKVSFSVAFGLVLGITLLVVAFQVVDSPKERQLKRQVDAYQRHLQSLRIALQRDEAVLADLENRDNNIYRTLLEAEPVTDDQRRSGIPNYERYEELREIDPSGIIASTTKLVDDFSKRLYVQSCSLDEVRRMADSKKDRQDCIPAIMPLQKNKCRILSGFGYRFHPILHYRRMHTGVDLSAATGTPIYATGNGTIETAGRNDPQLSGYGIAVLINHGYGYKTLYAHMSRVAVKSGQKVKRGELIGYVGSTGLSSGPHCHYEVWLNGKKVNPVFYFYSDLTPEEYEQVIEAANQENQCLS